MPGALLAMLDLMAESDGIVLPVLGPVQSSCASLHCAGRHTAKASAEATLVAEGTSRLAPARGGAMVWPTRSISGFCDSPTTP